MAKTFAQYLIDRTLPPDMSITRQVDKSYLNELLSEVARRYPDRYDETVSALKKLGDTFSTMEPVTMGLREIDVPNREKRDAIIRKYTALVKKDRGDDGKVIDHLTNLQMDLAKNDLDGTTDDASIMVRSALTGNKTQLMKLRTSPGVVGAHDGSVVPEIFPKSYAQGVDPLHFWLGAVESRRNIAQGAVSTAKPGEMLKVFSNVLAPSVVSSEDCGSERGILLGTRDDDIIDRYLARDTGKYKRDELVTPDVQKDLLAGGITHVLVRSPETCDGRGGSVCQMCMGLRPGTGKKWEIGDNAGLVTAGSLGEPLTQMTLSSKHSTSMAVKQEGLRGESGLRQFVESPKNYPNGKILCELIGTVFRIRPAPQGGQIITIHQTRPVPERYIVHGRQTPNMRGYWDYHIPPNLKPADGIEEGTEVWPGKELSTGVDNLKDIARLRNLGFARSSAAQNMYDIYKASGMKMDRRHFELLARNANAYVKIIKAPRSSGLLPGDTITYQELVEKTKSLPYRTVKTDAALGMVLAQGALDLTVGTEIDERARQYLKQNMVNEVRVTQDLEIAAATTPMTRVVNQSPDWLSAMSHRYLKDQLRDAASFGKKSNIHGYNPLAAYAYGTELGHGQGGTY